MQTSIPDAVLMVWLITPDGQSKPHTPEHINPMRGIGIPSLQRELHSMSI